ncbi:MAG TPA: polymer-forming cytoskeletal protein [Polyangiaceae bacterium]|jgi:cytoskeletal protein CcmA (bactofilin family)|nr:polymer-forming cytoskeletal protein [Polyangiaceae bacterium]
MTEPMNATHARKTLVEEGTQFKGSLSSSCPIEVKGRVEGDVTAPALTVSSSGAVHGRVKVGQMHSHGELAGEFDADEVQLSGSVKDKTVIRARSLEVKLSPTEGKMQVVFGECSLEVGADPAKADSAVRPPDAAARSAEPAIKGTSARPPSEGAEQASKASSVRPPAGANGA